jgi:hypothetical protein
VAGTVELLLPDRTAYAGSFAPDWLPLAAAAIAATGVVVRLRSVRRPHLHDGRRPRPGGLARSPRLGGALGWSGLLLLLWTAGGLPIDLLRLAGRVTPGLMPPDIDWPGTATRALALAALVVLARLALAGSPDAETADEVGSAHAARWYGYAALALALPYPVLKTWWALGGTFGLRWPGAAGLAGSLTLWLPAVPWLLAAALSLLLVLTPRWLPRRLLLIAGWSATAVVAMVGTAACWGLAGGLISGDVDFGEMAGWVFGLVYGSWLLWAIAAGAATRSCQVRGAGALTRRTGTAATLPSAGAGRDHRRSRAGNVSDTTVTCPRSTTS